MNGATRRASGADCDGGASHDTSIDMRAQASVVMAPGGRARNTVR